MKIEVSFSLYSVLKSTIDHSAARLKWSASCQWSCGSIESTTIEKTHPILVVLECKSSN